MTHRPIAALQAAAMPELHSAMLSSPQVNVLYLAPGQEIISPDQVRVLNPEILATGAGTQLAKISPSMLVKRGTHASLIEAKSVLYVAERTSVPVPRLFAAYAYGPLDRDVDDFGSVYDTYIFMKFIDGEDLGRSWGKCTFDEKQMLSMDLKKHMIELCSLSAAGYIGSVHEGPVTDIIEWSTTSRGPFESERDFNTTFADTFVARSKSQVGPYIRGMLDARKHGTVFTHGDLRPDNTIVKDGRITAILDWEIAGWYPDYWEFVEAFYLEVFVDDWGSHLLGVLTPYYCEQLVHAKLMSVLC